MWAFCHCLWTDVEQQWDTELFSPLKICSYGSNSLVSLVPLKFMASYVPLFLCARRPSSQHHLWLLQEAWHTRDALEVQDVLRLWPVHTVLHEQQARSVACLWALWDGALAAVSDALGGGPLAGCCAVSGDSLWALRLLFIHQIRPFPELVLISQSRQILLWNERHDFHCVFSGNMDTFLTQYYSLL